jgi:hypothetical protein
MQKGRRQLAKGATKTPVPTSSCIAHTTGVGGDNGIDYDKHWLRFPYVFRFSRSHYLHPHPYLFPVTHS